MTLTAVTHVVIHTAATPGRSIDISAASIQEYHVQKKHWTDIGYHWVVRKDGRVEPGRPEGMIGAHVEGFNAHSVGVCFSGNGDFEDFTDAQKRAGAELVADILRRHKLEADFLANPRRVIGHREINDLIREGVAPKARTTTKTCPGAKVDCSEFRRAVVAVVRGRLQ